MPSARNSRFTLTHILNHRRKSNAQLAGHARHKRPQRLEDRLELPFSLLDLAEHAAKPLRIKNTKRRGVAPNPLDAEAGEAATTRDADLLRRLSGTLGRMLIPMLSDPQPASARKKAEKAASGVRNAITLHPERGTGDCAMEDEAPRSREATIQARSFGRCSSWRKRLSGRLVSGPPNARFAISSKAKDGGLKVRTHQLRWAERFKDAGLENLEDSAPP